MKAIKRSVKRRRLLLIFWSSILLTSVLLIGQAFSASNTYLATETSGSVQEGTFVGPDTCGACHNDKLSDWEGGTHDLAWNASDHITPDRDCYTCHYNGTNFEDPSKFIGEDLLGFTATNTPVVDGVSCETCHGPYQGGAGPGHQPVTLAAELCGECHSPRHSTHGDMYERWKLSGHAYSNESLMEGGFEQPRCVHCMTAEGALPWPLGGVETSAESENGITCAVCHDPHSDENDHKLREAEVDELCVVCHTHEPTDAPHLGRETPEGEDANCATCHMYGRDYSSRTEAWDMNTNHTMGTWIESCGQIPPDENVTTCHANTEAAWELKDELIEQGEAKIAATEALAEEARAAYEAANTTAGVNPMKLAEATEALEALEEVMGEVGHAGTLTFHDPWFLEEMLDHANHEAQEVMHLSKAAMEPTGVETVTIITTVSEYGLPILVVLGMSAALIMAVLRRRRIA